jgi:Domain of unknown function (DUF3425)
MPDTRPKRKAVDVPIPAKGEDPTERKRVLNILAQRRYRQRRREHLKQLEAHVGVQSPPKSSAFNNTTSATCNIAQLQISRIRSPVESVNVADFQQSRDSGLLDDQDPFAMFDPDFVSTVPCDWNSLLPSLPGTPFTTDGSAEGHTLSLSSLPSPSTSKTTETPYSFPDEAYLPVLELDLLRGATAIASRLNISNLIWSLSSTSPFSDPSMALAQYDHLPCNLRPTPAQLTQPHHPILDLLPWPTVREKLILILSQPLELRPPSAKSSTALLEFVYDVEDSAEGVRIWGDDPYSDQAWEVGDKVFKNWWWAFDRDVIRRSNEMRRLRGARLLGEGTIMGDVA